ncbi:MAG: DUF3467 domain-containing protein [Alistipes sp.]|nr:DUF3467 domain-containing protein [Alistipes sp.]MBQ6988000.1 DUF3467 domain-containing protein [Alistipes sp.]MBR2006484.1 DUF3467 domain-containing protein [Alistipes sp.]
MAEFKKQGLDIELTEDIAQGNYSNLAIISHSTSEFIVDFATVLPGLAKAKVKSRVILTPEHAKRLLLSLQENITRYESNIGKIEIPQPSRNNEDPIVGMGPMGNA